MKNPFFSVIIPTFNRRKLLRKCILSIKNSEFKDMEIIVVDDGSTDGTSEMLSQLGCRYIQLDRGGAAHARNEGAKIAKGKYLVFIDSDVMILNDTLTKLQKHILNEGVEFACGHKMPVDIVGGSAKWVMLRKTQSYYKWSQKIGKKTTNSFVETAFMAIIKSKFNEIGGFDNSIKASGGEEHDFGHRLGFNIPFFSDLGVYHHYESYLSYWKKLFMRSYSFGNILCRDQRFEKGGFGTKDEAVNSIISLLILLNLAGILLSGYFGAIATFFFLALLWERRQFYLRVLHNMGMIWALCSPILDIGLYFMNALGSGSALIVIGGKKAADVGTSILDFSKIILSRTPPNIGFFVTARCNMMCKHCFYWKQIRDSKNRQELTLSEIQKISMNLDTLYYLTITGGEPSLRKDLPQICKAFHDNNNCKMISYHTNGYLTDEIVRHAKEILEICPNAHLNIALSLDGPEKIHNLVRNNNKSYQHVMATYLELNKIRNPRLGIQFSGVLSAYNKDSMVDAYNSIDQLGSWYGNTLARGNTYDPAATNVSVSEYNKLFTDVKSVTGTGLVGFFDFIRNGLAMNMPVLVSNVMKYKSQALSCKAGKKSIVISDIGEVYACEMLEKQLGNLRKSGYNMKKILCSQKAKAVIKGIKNNKCHCTHEGNMYVNMIFNPLYFIRQSISYAIKRGRHYFKKTVVNYKIEKIHN